MTKLLERVKALLLEACNLSKKWDNVKDFRSTSFNNFEEAKRDFVEAKRNHVFSNNNLFSDIDLDQDFV